VDDRTANVTADTVLGEKAITEEPNGDLVIEGWASTWEEDRQGERFIPGGFRDCIKSFLAGGAPLLYQHKDGEQMGTVESLEERPQGLWAKARVPRPPAGTEASHRYELLKRGMLRGLSVRGRMLKRGRDLMMKDLYEISTTPVPVNAGGLLEVGAKALSSEDDTPPAEDPEAAAVRERLQARFDEASATLAAAEALLSERDAPEEREVEKGVSAEQRKKHGMSGGEFPIWHCGKGPGGVGAALSDLGRTKLSRSAVMAHIRSKAKALGCTERYPALKSS
jgi:HK97 family phage prohead protease